MGKKKHIASYAHVSIYGFNTRVGTHYIYDNEEAKACRHKPHFRFRNDQCRKDYVDYWSQKIKKSQSEGK